MAPLPPESTARFYLDYSDGVNEHTIVARMGAGASVAEAIASVDLFLTALSGVLFTLTVIGARVSSDNSNVTNPVTWTGSASYGTGTITGNQVPRELRFQGRSTDGRRVSVSVYGFNEDTPATYRINADAIPEIDDAIEALTGAGAVNVFLTISTLVPVWKTYASVNYNSYWERKARP